jgi:two-component system LytT family response regulator
MDIDCSIGLTFYIKDYKILSELISDLLILKQNDSSIMGLGTNEIDKNTIKEFKKTNYDNLISSVKNHINQLLIVKTNDGFQSIDKSQIIRIESSSNYSTIYLIDGSTLLSAKTLGNYEDILIDSGFFRIHNSHLINIIHFKLYVLQVTFITSGSVRERSFNYLGV